MSENKFRGKSVRTGGWIYGYYVKHETRQTCPIGEDKLTPDEIKRLIVFDSFADWNMPKTLQAIEVIPETVGQYTGLKDKNGKEIFEGDIVACGDGEVPTEIRWVQESSAFMAYNIKRKEYHLLNKYFDRFIGEVIGNIHDNPEVSP